MPMPRSIIALLLLLSVTLPAEAETPCTPSDTPTEQRVIDANHASADDLQTLKGLGPRKAAAIVAERQQHGAFIDARDLTRVKGIGQRLANTLEQRLSFHRP
ncbi:ComEA family DNA-binding protein [Zymobacter sp. IVIA_12111.31 C1]|uniref:ComEA family DNA-binding protein n=1 Tax=Zymobacter sp. IVIA_12111.31 C1 TaxID=3394854 RepID=UPI0039C083C9